MKESTVRKSAFDRFYDELAYKPWCGDDKAARLVRPKDKAVTRPYIAPNAPSIVSWLVFDLDHSNPWIWADKGLPEPNIIVSNRSSGYSHLYYAINPVCTSDNAHQKPITYMDSVYRGMARALEADEAYTGRIAKNPLCDHWNALELHFYQYSLGDLAAVVAPISKPFFNTADIEDVNGRNCSLFLKLRLWAYGCVYEARETGTQDDWLARVEHKALSLSMVEIDFKHNEILGVARSVAKWTWTKYTGSRVDRGVMNLSGSDLSLKDKQSLSGKRTHRIRVSDTTERIERAIEQLKTAGKKITKVAVAALAGLSRQQIHRKYRELFSSLTTGDIPYHSTGNQDITINEENVTFGVHQISAGLKLLPPLKAVIGLKVLFNDIKGDCIVVANPINDS